MNQDQRRLAAIMITDIVGYSAIMQRDETLALDLLEQHRTLLRRYFSAHNGHEIKTIGDAFLVEFHSALEAACCAVDAQTALKEYNDASAPERRLHIRIGIHVGEVLHRQGDVFGDAVNIAARLEPLAGADGICISEPVFAQIRNLDFPIVSLGRQALKNIGEPLEIFKIDLFGVGWSATTVTPTKTLTSIAVLPFANLSSNEENEYFSDGLTDDITAQLARIGALKVISRTSSMQYKNTDKNLRQIGKELGVSTILEGSVRRVGSRVRIVAQLINAQTDEPLWSDTYDRELSDIFDIQIEVAEQIAAALKAQISAAEKQRIARAPTENFEAYQLYLKGRFYWAKRSEGALKTAIEYFQQALKKDPDYAQAYAGLALVYNALGDWIILPPSDAYSRAKTAARQALKLDGLSAKAFTSLAHVRRQYDWDWVGAEHEFKRAIKLNPAYSTAHHWYAECLAAMGRLDEALDEIKRAQELDPFSLQINASLGLIMYFSRQYERAVEQYQKTLEIDEDYFAVRLFLGSSFLQKGMHQEAITQYEQAFTLSGDSPLVLAWLGHAQAASGNQREATNVLHQLESLAKRHYVSPFSCALLYWGFGDRDKAFEWFENAFADRSLWIVYLLHVDPLFDSWRSDPRCRRLLKHMGFSA